jgi:hypothetical protein
VSAGRRRQLHQPRVRSGTTLARSGAPGQLDPRGGGRLRSGHGTAIPQCRRPCNARQTRARPRCPRGLHRPRRRGRGREGHGRSGLHPQRLPRPLVRGAGQGLLRGAGPRRHPGPRLRLGRHRQEARNRGHRHRAQPSGAAHHRQRGGRQPPHGDGLPQPGDVRDVLLRRGGQRAGAQGPPRARPSAARRATSAP